MYYIYEIKNNINNKTYIGQHHTNNLKDNYMGSGSLLHQAYEKYGIKNFSKSILAITETKENINILEKHFISLFREEGKAEYNIADGGDGGNVLNYLSEEQIYFWKKKIGEKSKGHKLSKDARKKISDSRIGITFSEETRRKIGEASRNRICSEETRRKMSLSQKGKKKKPMSDEGKENIRKAHIGKIPWNKGKPTNCRWYNNGYRNVLSKECPVGFTPGRIGRKWTEAEKIKVSKSMRDYWDNKNN